ncbi:MAG: CO dehydrogenase/CO-methylating acetyl-CoA synthase complex subunit beta [Euryarchaeota archaeon]|nr:CO dehydrogenase/CO-methylating acetyl-CoA synthase complex subunit beta [Euryarchaeota archaeon]
MELPVDVGVIYEGERISGNEVFVELGGEEGGVELLRVVPAEEVRDGRVLVTGRDVDEMEEGGRYPFGILVKIAGRTLEEDVEGVLERRIHEFLSYIQGVMHQNSRDRVVVRISKQAVERGLRLRHVAHALVELLRREYPAVERVQVELITSRERVEALLREAREVYRRRDEKAAELRDEDVDVFYGCAMCQNHAANHVCIITPSRVSGCGVISWHEARAAAKMGESAIFEVSKGELLQEEKGEYSGVNAAVADRSRGTTQRVYIHSIFEHPHTQCSCAQAIVFYIPEVDALGVVDHGFRGKTPFGVDFSTLLRQVGNGVQHPGFAGIGLGYLRSPKFLQGDGGWERVVWMPSHLKESLRDVIPAEAFRRIATEKEAPDLESLRRFLEERGFPLPAEERRSSAQAYALPRHRVNITFINSEIYFKKLIIMGGKEKNI